MRHVRVIGSFMVAALGIAGKVAGQASPPPCTTSLEQLDAKVRQDYAGFLLEIRGPRKTSYDSMFSAASARAAGLDADQCLDLLREYVAWYQDPHLFLYQTARLDSAESRRRRESVATLPFDTIAYQRSLEDPSASRDPLEGIWTDGRLRAAILPDGDPHGQRFVAVILTPDSTNWPLFAVRARFRRLGAGEYRVDLSLPNYALRRSEAALYRNDLLRFSPGTWGREAPASALTPGQLDPRDPRRPTLRVHAGTVIVAMPSHDPAYRQAFDSLIRSNAEALRRAERLIFDLRGNEGGSAGTSDPIVPYIVSDGQSPPPALHQADALMLSSADQIAYAQRAFGSPSSGFVRGLVARMTSAPGRLVPLYDPSKPPEEEALPRAILGPRKVALVIDRGTVSAAEVILLYAKQSARVTVYGEPSEGALDYQSINIVPIDTSEHRFFLGYPTITRNGRLPEHGIRGHGIAPDVALDFARLTDPIGWLEEDLKRR